MPLADPARRRTDPPATSTRLPHGFRITLADDVRFWADGSIATGGSPWGVVRFSVAARPALDALRRGGRAGLACRSDVERAVGRRLLDRGMAQPCVAGGTQAGPVTVVIPVLDRVASLRRCLTALGDLDVVVVDDGSEDPESVRRAAEDHGATIVRHPVNRGPAAARNTGLRVTHSPYVAFVDSDCAPEPGWLQTLLQHFADPKVGAVAARVVPHDGSATVLSRHELARSALDMGTRPEQVRPGGRLGFVPSAALLVRRDALAEQLFDERLRLGEDVDFGWRLVDAGWYVRYEPAAVVRHESRVKPRPWITRRFEYGTSAAALARRHPGRLAPARFSAWNLGSLLLLAAGRRRRAALVAAATSGLLTRRLAEVGAGPDLASTIVAKGLLADAAAAGHALRREWWPLGALCLAGAARSRPARAGAACMLAPVLLEWARHRPQVDLPRYTALRLVEDAAYGSGVIVSAWRERTAAPLLPEVRLPRLPRLRRSSPQPRGNRRRAAN